MEGHVVENSTIITQCMHGMCMYPTYVHVRMYVPVQLRMRGSAGPGASHGSMEKISPWSKSTTQQQLQQQQY